jgi:protein-tyrosine-phosphatase
MKKYLFICQHNFIRSRYGAEFFRGFLKGENKEGKVYSAGLGIISIFLGRRVSKKLLIKMDWIFVMENYMKEELIRKFKIDEKKIVVLNIKDIYGPGKSKDVDELDKLLESKNFGKYL